MLLPRPPRASSKLLDLRQNFVSHLYTKMERAAYTPKEFAALFGKSQTWGYRQIYSGKVASTTEHGRTLIPAREVEKVLKSAQRKGSPESPREETKPTESVREVLIRGAQQRPNQNSSAAGIPSRRGSKP